MKYRIPEPYECFECEGQCYARDWFHYTTTGKPYYPKGIAAIYWQCSKCGRRFETLEYVDAIMIEVEKLPKAYSELTYVIVREEEE